MQTDFQMIKTSPLKTYYCFKRTNVLNEILKQSIISYCNVYHVFEVSLCTANCVYSKVCHVSKRTGFRQFFERIGEWVGGVGEIP